MVKEWNNNSVRHIRNNIDIRTLFLIMFNNNNSFNNKIIY